MKNYLYEVAGFDIQPKGKLLSRFLDLESGVGVAYERCIAYNKDFHIHDRLNLTFPRSSSRIDFVVRSPKKIYQVHDRSLLWMPAYVEHKQDTRSMIYDNLALFPEKGVIQETVERVSRRYGMPLTLPSETVMERRSPVLDELLNDYFVERVLERKPAQQLSHLAFQILEESLRIILCPKQQCQQEHSTPFLVVDGDPAISKVIRYIEGNLFSPLDSKLLTKQTSISSATLFRRFKQEMGITPGEYVTQRRFDEALSLLQSGDYQVTDVALIVGYGDVASFSKAFKFRFGKSPIHFLMEHRLDG